MEYGTTPGVFTIPFANEGSTRTVLTASQIGITDGRISLTDGFPPLTMTAISSGGVPPAGEDMNGIMKWVSQVCQWSQAGGGMPFSSALSDAQSGYPKGARVMSSDGTAYWQSRADGNTDDPDSAYSNQWMPDGQGSVTITLTTGITTYTLSPAEYKFKTIIIAGTVDSNVVVYFPVLPATWNVINQISSYSIIASTTTATNTLVLGINQQITQLSGSVYMTPSILYSTSAQSVTTNAVATAAWINTKTAKSSTSISLSSDNYLASPGWISAKTLTASSLLSSTSDDYLESAGHLQAKMLYGTAGLVYSNYRIVTSQWIYNYLNSILAAVISSAGFAYSFAESGYIKLPSWLGGFMFQWSSATTVASDSAAAITFPTTFSNACYLVLTTGGTNLVSSGTTQGTINAINISTSGFAACNDGATCVLRYIAIGY